MTNPNWYNYTDPNTGLVAVTTGLNPFYAYAPAHGNIGPDSVPIPPQSPFYNASAGGTMGFYQAPGIGANGGAGFATPTVQPGIAGAGPSGVTQNLTNAQFVAANPGLTIKTPTANFSLPYKGCVLSFTTGVPVACDLALVAALTAVGAPVV